MILQRRLFRVSVGSASWPCIASCAEHARRKFTKKGYKNPVATYVRTLGGSIGEAAERVAAAEPPAVAPPAPESFGQKLLTL